MSEPQPSTPTKALVVRMDRSRDFSTVHGERLPGDRHAKVFFYQDRLPFDAAGVLIHDHPDVLEDETLKERVALMQKRAAKRAKDAPGDEDADNNGEDGEPVTVNLVSWARGEEKFPWQDLSNAIARRFSKRVSNKRDALELLVEEHVVSVGQLAEPFKKLLQD